MAFLFRPLFCNCHADVCPFSASFLTSCHSSHTSSSLLFVGTQLALDFHYTERDCVKWYIYQEVGTQLLIAAVESILIIRGTLPVVLP